VLPRRQIEGEHGGAGAAMVPVSGVPVLIGDPGAGIVVAGNPPNISLWLEV